MQGRGSLTGTGTFVGEGYFFADATPAAVSTPSLPFSSILTPLQEGMGAWLDIFDVCSTTGKQIKLVL